MTDPVVLDGESLTIEQLVAIARDGAEVACDPRTDERVAKAEALIARIVDNYTRAWQAGEAAVTEYGVTTGFGEFKDKPIAPGDLEQLQRNLLLSHSVGVGEHFAAEVVRGALVTRLNAFLKGHSGVRRKLVKIVEAMLNRGVIPIVPIHGSVGASGDLCPLSHLFGVLLGAGRFYTTSDSNVRDAHDLPNVLGFSAEELLPTFKEGLALVNGANFSATLLALGVYDAERLATVADTNAALALEALGGCTRALDSKVHEARGQRGQIESAASMRAALAGSRLVERSGAVQDVYSIRCAPQVHGATRDAIRYASDVATRELNAATDNPLFFPDGSESEDLQFRENWPEWYRGDQRLAYSAGNFHGQPLALAADFLGIAAAELANIAERRTQALLDSNQNRGLPPNLTTRPGVNSGLMIAQYTAASLVSENKVLAHPASVDSIPTGANAEDHVSMSTHAGRKLRSIVENAEAVLAIERLVVAQAIEWRVAMIEGVPEAHTLPDADKQAVEFERAVRGHANDIALFLGQGTRGAYLAVRAVAEPVFRDRPLSDDVRRVRGVLTRTNLSSGA
jgi:histidine ammonia-lyase